QGARPGRRRAGAVQGAQGAADPVGRPRCLSEGAGGLARADGARQRGIVPASRLGLGRHSPRDGPTRGGQPVGVGRRQAAADAGCRDTMATAEEGVIICGMVRNATLALLLSIAFAAPLAAQAPDAAAPETAAPAQPRSMAG